MEPVFTAEPIPAAIEARMRGVSYPEDAEIKLSDLRYLRLSYVDFEDQEQVGELVCNKAIAEDLLAIFKDLYEAANPGVKITYNFDSSGTLKTQIQEGAECDLFISAGQKQMNQLDSTASAEVNTEGLDFVLQGSRINLLENKVVLVVPDGNPKGIESFDQLAELLKSGDVLMAMGNSDVPVGQYTQKILSPTAPMSKKSRPRSARRASTAASSTAPMPSPPV